jgi:uncharacterized repeat protein (TIGR03803 family)
MKSRKPASIFFAVLAVTAITFSLAVSAQAQTETILHNFDDKGDGGSPYGGLLLDSAGNLYGTTSSGGNLTGCVPPFGCGVSFELSKLTTGRWDETVLRDFSSTGGSDASLIADAAGNLYGTTLFGGSPITCVDYGDVGCGSVFVLSHTATGWTRTVIYGFTGGTDGALPYDKLTFDSAGNLYGTTAWGGNLTACTNGCGTVFELSPNGNGTWTETVLYAFTNKADGGGTNASVVFDAAGNLYGTSPFTSPGAGGIWELSPTGTGTWNFQMIYTFTGGADGATPYGGVAFDSAGNIYTTTDQAGDLTACRKDGCGTVIELSPVAGGGWSESTIFTFTGPNGAHSLSTPLLDRAGNLYIAVHEGGAKNDGLLFELSPGSGGTWTQTVLHTFGSTTDDGQDPGYGFLIMDSTGAIYGTTYAGGKYNYGTVYKIVP